MPSANAGSARPSAFHTQLCELLEVLDRLESSELGDASSAEAVRERHAAVLLLLERTSRVVSQVVEHYEHDAAQRGSSSEPSNRTAFDRGVDTLVEQLPSGGRVADVGFMAGLELRQKDAALRHLTPNGNRFLVLATMESACRRIRKSVTAVGTVLCRTEGLETTLSFESEAAAAIETRKAFARLRASINGDFEPSRTNIESRLTDAKIEIAILMGRPVYRSLRIEDRSVVRGVQVRLLEWLRSPPTDERLDEGMRLWGDISGVAASLRRVSERQALLEHDLRVVRIARGAIMRGGGDSISPALFDRLDALRGRSDEIDSLLSTGDRRLNSWREPFRRLLRELREPEDSDRIAVSPITSRP